MVMSIRDLQERRAARPPEHAGTKQGEAQTAAQIARLHYGQQCHGRELSERDLFVILQRNMQQWQQQNVPPEWQLEYIRAWNNAALSEEPKREATRSARDIAARMGSFGALLRFLRERADLKQWQIVDQLPENHRFTQISYGYLERGRLYPPFEELATLYKALLSAGVEISPQERAAYILLACQSNEVKKRKRQRITPAQWEALSNELAAFDDSTPLLVPLVAPRPAPAIAASVPAPQTLQRQEQEPTPPVVPAHRQATAAPAELLAPALQAPAEQQQMYTMLLQTAGQLGAMVAQLATLSQQFQGGTTC